MAVPATTIYPRTATWNSHTWNSSSGGPLRFEWDVSGDPFEDWTGDSDLPTFLGVVNQKARAKIRIREPKITDALGTKSNIVLTLVGKNNTATINLVNMILFSNTGEQDRAQGGMCTLSFAHESADGTTSPIS